MKKEIDNLCMGENFLNHIFLKNRIAELKIKQWWLADQIGVDRKTVSRWIQGKVRSIQSENLNKLSQVLSCDPSQLIVKDQSEQMANPEDQKIAAALLSTSSLIDKLGPIGEWNVIESLLRAQLIPGLPLQVLGEIYDQLCVASWRQSKLEQAEKYNQKSLEVAKALKDYELLASGLLSKANLQSWRGQIQSSIQSYEECLRLEKYISARKLGSVHSNYGAVLYEAGDFLRAELPLLNSINLFRLEGRPANLSISYCHLAILNLAKGDVEKSQENAKVSIQYAKRDEYFRGIHMGGLILSEIAARQNRDEEAKALLDESLKGFSQLGIEEGLNYEFAGRIERILGNLSKSIGLLNFGIGISKEFPIYHAALHFELAISLKAAGDPEWFEMAQKAMSLFTECQCPMRAEVVKNALN